MNSQHNNDDLGWSRRDELGRLEIHVYRRLGGRLRDFHLTVQEDRLVLHGHATSFHAKQLAQHAVMEATDLPIAVNAIAVAHDAGAAPPTDW